MNAIQNYVWGNKIGFKKYTGYITTTIISGNTPIGYFSTLGTSANIGVDFPSTLAKNVYPLQNYGYFSSSNTVSSRNADTYFRDTRYYGMNILHVGVFFHFGGDYELTNYNIEYLTYRGVIQEDINIIKLGSEGFFSGMWMVTFRQSQNEKLKDFLKSDPNVILKFK